MPKKPLETLTFVIERHEKSVRLVASLRSERALQAITGKSFPVANVDIWGAPHLADLIDLERDITRRVQAWLAQPGLF